MQQFINNFSTFGGFSVEYLRLGKGTKVILAFHGFGRSFHDFEFLEPLIGERFTIYAIHILHHGGSTYPENRVEQGSITSKELVAIYKEFLNHLNVERFSLVGYSLGGKMALTLTEHLSDRIDHLILLAPDGIVTNKWYKFAAHNSLGRRLTKFAKNNPNFFLRFADFLKWSRLVPAHLHRFAYLHLDTSDKRELVYRVWISFRNLRPDIPTIQTKINELQLPTLLIFGKYDRVIRPRIGKHFAAPLKNHAALHLVEAGHILLTPEHGVMIRDFISP